MQTDPSIPATRRAPPPPAGAAPLSRALAVSAAEVDGGAEADNADGRAESGHRRPLSYFFVRGHPRSGTNWVSRLLNLHPRLRCTGEWHLNGLTDTLEWINARPWVLASKPPYRGVLARGVRQTIRECLRAAAADDPRITHAGDRTPAALTEMLPGAKSIVVVRDGRDVLVSLTYHNLSGKGRHFLEGRLAEPMLELVERFRADPFCFVKAPQELLSRAGWVTFASREWARRVQRDQATMARMNAEESRVLRVAYEELHRDVEGVRREMYRFLGVDPAEAAPVGSAPGTAPGLASEDPTAYSRKGEPGDWRRYFTRGATEIFMREAGEALASLGYTADPA